jgi:RNA polymerase sigma factor (sigma-70 family)
VAVVSMNLARSGIRRRMAERRARARLSGRGGALDVEMRGPATLAAEERVDVERALRALSRRQREAVVLRYYLDMSMLEVAGALGVSTGTAKTTLFRARAVLSRALGVAGDRSVEEENDRAER